MVIVSIAHALYNAGYKTLESESELKLQYYFGCVVIDQRIVRYYFNSELKIKIAERRLGKSASGAEELPSFCCMCSAKPRISISLDQSPICLSIVLDHQ
jgi:hypothetical protein